MNDKRRFEYTRYTKGNASYCFWEAWTEPTGPTGYLVVCRWGRRGTSGQRREWFHGTQAAATAELSEKVGKQLRKGRDEVTEKKDPKRQEAARKAWVTIRKKAAKKKAAKKKAAKKKKRKKAAVKTEVETEKKVWLSPRRRLPTPEVEN